MGILAHSTRPSAVSELLSIRVTAQELQTVISQLADRVEAYDETALAHHSGRIPGRELENRALGHLQCILEHAGAAAAEDLSDQLKVATQRFHAQAQEGRYDGDTADRLRTLRELQDDELRGVYSTFVRYAQRHLDEADSRLAAMKEVAGELHTLLAALDSEELVES